jgi:hypothetical protein
MSSPAQADGVPSVSEVLDKSGIFAAGYLSGGYTAGFNKGDAFTDRVFETVGSANTFEFNQAALILAHAPSDGGFGGKVVTIAGTDAKLLNIFYGSTPADIALFIAELTYKYGGLNVELGRFPALSGYELAPIALNDNISRSLVLAIAQPVPLTGVRFNYTVTDTLTAVLAVSNSDVIDGTTAAAATDDNKQKALEFGGSYAPSKAFKLAIYDYYSVEAEDNGGKNDILDLVATWAVTNQLQFAFNGDYLRTYNNTIASGLHLFAGPATIKTGGDFYINYKYTPQWSSSLRLEYIRVSSDAVAGTGVLDTGAIPAVVNYLSEATLTGRYTASKNFRILGEFRVDHSTVPTFANGAEPAKHDSELRINAIYSFGGV